VTFGVLLFGIAVVLLLCHGLFLGTEWWPFGHPRTPRLLTCFTLHQRYLDVLHFRESVNRYPRSLEELESHMEKTISKRQVTLGLIDGWGNRFRYVHLDLPHDGEAFDLYSKGPNGIDESKESPSGDDIHIMANGLIR
jgi:hypothetical protein